MADPKRSGISLEALIEDYATEPVPDGVFFTGWQISMVNSALAISLPGLLTGAWLGLEMGLLNSTIAFVLGGLVLAVIATLAGFIGVRNRLSSYMIINKTFGVLGARVVNLALALSMFLFFAVNAELFNDAAQGVFKELVGWELQGPVFLIGGCALMTASTIFGFKSLQFLSTLLLPFLIIAFGVLVYDVVAHTSLDALLAAAPTGNTSIGAGVSAVVGSFIVGAIVMPDSCRFGRNRRDAVVAAFKPFLLVSTLVYIGSAVAALKTGEQDLVQIMYASGLGFSAFVLVIVSSLIGNAVNLYGCALSMAALFPRVAEWKLSIVCGLLGLALSLVGVLSHFMDMIFSLGVVFSPIVAFFVIDHLLPERANGLLNVPAMVAWALGIGVSVLTSQDVLHLTWVPACDSILVAAVVYLAIRQCQARLALRQLA
ncbi:MAG: cytosine permease [Pseudomonas sp.]